VCADQVVVLLLLYQTTMNRRTNKKNWLLGLSVAILALLVLFGLLTVVRVYALPTSQASPGPCQMPAVDNNNKNGNDNGNGLGQCDLCDQASATNKGVNDLDDTLAQWLVYGQSTCNAELGIYNVTSYFPALLPTLIAIRTFDNINQPPTNVTPITTFSFLPAVPQAYPGGSGLGVNTPTLVGNVLNHSRFDKFQSVPYSIGFFFNLSMETIATTDVRLSVFLKNVGDRGPNNLEHRRYKAALTKSKVVGRYADRIKRFVTNVYDSWVINKLPLLSTFKDRMVDFFLDIHLGTADHPAFVKAYFSDFLFFISTTDTAAVSAMRTMSGHMNTKCVREYFTQRITAIISGTMTDTITWNWIEAGMPVETVAMEMIHNIVAFSQFDNTVHLIVSQALNPAATTPGTGGYTFLTLFKLAGTGLPLSFDIPGGVNPAIYVGTPEQLQINVVREYVRMMLPNNLWFSSDVTQPYHVQTRHVPQLIQLRAEYEKAGIVAPWSPAGSAGWNAALPLTGTYSPSRYAAGFMAKFSDAIVGGTATSPAFDATDLNTGLVSSIASFTRSPVDNETQIPAGDSVMIPVFPYPTFAPWGLGARRCPGEIFNQFIIFQMFQAFQNLTFYDDCTLNPSFCNPVSPSFKYPFVPLAPFKAVPDSLFVASAV